jgi:hypothetical protein
MTTPQDPAKRHKQKARRSKQLANWRDKNPANEVAGGSAPAVRTVPAAPAAKKSA